MPAHRARSSSSKTRGTPRPRLKASPRSPVPKARESEGVSAQAEGPAPAPALTASRKRELRAEAHALSPIVQIGHQGIHAAAIAAVTRALRDHELIKVRLHEPEDKRAMAQELAESARAALCGLVGHTVILYKPKPKPKRPR